MHHNGFAPNSRARVRHSLTLTPGIGLGSFLALLWCAASQSAETSLPTLQRSSPSSRTARPSPSLTATCTRSTESGRRTFVDHLFDPDFYKKNYRVQDGKVFQLDPKSGTLYPVTRTFRDGFEGAASADDLFTATRWHTNMADPKRAGQKDNYYALGNRVTLSREVVHSGKAALRCYAVPSSKGVSKASISKGIMYFKKGDDVYFSGWFFIEDTPSLYDAGGFTLFDLESTFHEVRRTPHRFSRTNDSLTFELELPKTQFRQDRGSEVSFPTGRWVHDRNPCLPVRRGGARPDLAGRPQSPGQEREDAAARGHRLRPIRDWDHRRLRRAASTRRSCTWMTSRFRIQQFATSAAHQHGSPWTAATR